eukprot:GEMP01011822.1.p1 GENE.GEMP01011822.1~~GEMP01011822.1.p1  ORF type:complete len:445 (+),score=108.58 GEMP01011822.1:988-2322(+)
MRRGISFVDEGEEIRLLRRGLPKFFDVPLLDSDATRISNTTGRYHVYSLEKANGENAQITRYDDLWVCCSKNVSLVAKNANDLALYTGDRYSVAKEIAEVFFAQFDKLQDSDKTHVLTLCEKYTLVGELVGVHQHLVAYDAPAVQFYALVPHEGDVLCVSPPKAMELLAPLQRVQLLHLGEFSSWKEVQDGSMGESERIKLSDGMEGRVLYVVENDEVLALAKTKAIEYRALRKLREKGKRVASGTSVHLIHKLYMTEMADFTDDACFLNRCSDRAQKFFDFVASHSLTTNEVQDNILDIIDKSQKGESQLVSRLRAIVAPPFLLADLKAVELEEANVILRRGENCTIVWNNPLTFEQFVNSKKMIVPTSRVDCVLYGWDNPGIDEAIMQSCLIEKGATRGQEDLLKVLVKNRKNFLNNMAARAETLSSKTTVGVKYVAFGESL